MAPQLKNALSVDLAPGASSTIPHGLNNGLAPLAPDIIFIPSPDLEVTGSDTVSVTIANRGPAAVVGDVLLESWHTIERSFDGATDLPVKPYIVVAAESNDQPPWPPYPVVQVVLTIYARTTGSDSSGDGSLANPYRTFQRAIRDVPHAIPPNTRYVVEITGLGVEMLPDGYQFPTIQGTSWASFFPSSGFFVANGVLTVEAIPQPASNIPSGDTMIPSPGYTVSADPDTGLAILTLTGPARASWAADSLKGKFLALDRVLPTFSGAFSCAIYGSDPTHLYLCNVPAGVYGDALICEPSAGFMTNTAGDDGGGVDIVGCNSIALHGLSFACVDGSLGLSLASAQQPWIELCDISGIITQNCLEQVYLNASVVRDAGFDIEASNCTPVRSLILNNGYLFFGEASCVVRRSVFDGNASFIGGSEVFADNGGAPGYFEMINVLVKNSTDPQAAFLGRGAQSWTFQDVRVDGSAGDAIRFEGCVGPKLNHITGAGNAGVGIRVNDGASARILDTGTTTVTGAGGDMIVGTKPARAWGTAPGVPAGNFTFDAPINNEFDITSPPVGDEVTGAGTGGTSGSRLFRRP